MNEIFNQLVLGNSDDLPSEVQRNFLNLHNDIMYCGRMAERFVTELARSLKKMKTSELFTAAGFSSFKDYVEEAVGIKERQAYNYIKIFDEFSEEFLQSNAKIGVTKLALLASADDEVRTEILENSAADDMTVRELKAKIEELEKAAASRMEQLSILESERNEKAAEILGYTKDIESDRQKLQKLEEEKSKLKKTIDELKAMPPKVEQIDNPETAAELEKAKKKLEDKENELAAVEKKLEIASDQNMTRFKVKFEDMQAILNDIISIMAELDEEKRGKCKNALRNVIKEYGI